MQLIQIFLPLYDNNKQAFDRSLYDDLRAGLKEKFGGVTFYRSAPVITEVITSDLHKEWWQQFKQGLEQVFKQEEILIRSIVFEKL